MISKKFEKGSFSRELKFVCQVRIHERSRGLTVHYGTYGLESIGGRKQRMMDRAVSRQLIWSVEFDLEIEMKSWVSSA